MSAIENVEITNQVLEECQKLFDKVEEWKKEGFQGWEKLFEHENGLIYRRALKENPNLYEILTFGSFPNIDSDRFVLAQNNLDYRKTWDQNMQSSSTLATDPSDNSEIIHWEVKYPWPMSNRDYVYKQRFLKDSASSFYVAVRRNLFSHPLKPPSSKVVRVPLYRSDLCAKPSDDLRGTHYVSLYFEDPDGSLPSWLVNWALKKAVPGYFDHLESICSKKWDDFLAASKT